MLLREGQLTLAHVASVLSSASSDLGIPDTCLARSVLVQGDADQWMHHVTVLRVGSTAAPPDTTIVDFRAGPARLIGAQFSAGAVQGHASLSDILTTWAKAVFSEQDLKAIQYSAYGPPVVEKLWDFQETAQVYHHPSRSRFDPLPCWVVDVFNRQGTIRGRNAPRGPFSSLDHEFYAEDLGAVVELWATDATQRDSGSVLDAYRVIIPDNRGYIKELKLRDRDIVVVVNGADLGTLTCAMTVRRSGRKEVREQKRVIENEVVFTLPESAESLELFLIDREGSWCDRYFETELVRPWGRPTLLGVQSTTSAGSDAPDFIGPWRVTRPLGKGAQARTFLVERGGQFGVAKVILGADEGRGVSREEQIKRFQTEVNTLTSLHAEGCPRIVQVLDTNAGGRLGLEEGAPYYVMPYYEAGPLRTPDGTFVEGISGNIDRVLEIGALVADTLAFMHERAVPVVHRDVHTGNILLSSPQGEPILGDFGLAYEQERTVSPDRPGTRESAEFGPWRWRPPELTQASINKRNPKSDVYMLGGVIYECLSGGDYVDDVEPAPGTFAHESPPKNLTRKLSDRRVPLVNALLRNVLIRNPELRLTARQLRDGLQAIRTYPPEQPPPELPKPPALTVAEARLAETRRVRVEKARWEQRERVIRLALGIGYREEKPRWQVSRIIDASVGDPKCASLYPDFVFGACVRVLIGVDLQSAEIPFIYSCLWLGRSATEEVALAERYQEAKAEELWRSFPDDPRLVELLTRGALKEVERLSSIYAELLQQYVQGQE